MDYFGKAFALNGSHPWKNCSQTLKPKSMKKLKNLSYHYN